jgi:hypothetical protein
MVAARTSAQSAAFCGMHFAEIIEKRMGLAVSVCVCLIRSHLDLREGFER